MHKNKIHFITLFALIIFCFYIFVNLLFPYANIISVSFLSVSVGLFLYCLFDPSEILITSSLGFAFLSIIIALSRYMFTT